mmetsp:Transcript_15253/g.32923  ORF Transcript_15253/g.32923 Transcript_15253/m.32923 type:complete len:537 (+) Transcript_15253:104-1714(+)|eukprot:CAMPEP_0206444368 /NCGR_PEP_ID=MMETSP0324_2-20121206/14873_1 /ASSEMBLY_ACC=CAM_ASM_000836 /TAXON_ID=2866 /ORGANISM="Crypthecodinium cohnii, Strain Seligo" /LENGTH=536 /DNA_ID=CAMNT_0053912383 /DNA_START=94 /DNA_END=1704 /DNA_ORIENTATION=+
MEWGTPVHQAIPATCFCSWTWTRTCYLPTPKIGVSLLLLGMLSIPSNLVAQGASDLPDMCDLQRVSAKSLKSWHTFEKRGHRGSIGVVITDLFGDEELTNWTAEAVLRRHGDETFYSDDTRGNYAFPRLGDYIRENNPARTIFVSDSLIGAFGESFQMASLGTVRRRNWFKHFDERPIFSVGVGGGAVPKHGAHPETWNALLQGRKVWFVGDDQVPDDHLAWEDPCQAFMTGALASRKSSKDPKICVQKPGEAIYFGADIKHSTCCLEDFNFAVGSQGHTGAWPPLIRAANGGHESDLKKLIDKAKSAGTLQALLLEQAGSYGQTALHRAALHGHEGALLLLLEAGTPPDARDAEGHTPLFLAAFSGHLSIIEELLSRSPNMVEDLDPKGSQVLQWAATQGHVEVVKALVNRFRANPVARDFAGGGPIAAAATMGHFAILRFLLDQPGGKAEAIQGDERSLTAIHWAALHGHGDVVALLLEETKASPTAKSSEGATPIDLARQHGRNDIVEQLLSHKAQRKKPRRRQQKTKAPGEL